MHKPPLTTARTFFLSLTVLILAACNTQSVKEPPPVVSGVIPVNNGAPSISGLKDLGGLDIGLGEVLPKLMSDERFSPGEWLLVQGKNLGVSSLSIDGVTVPIDRYFGNYPLLRIPTGLSPLKQHTLTLTHAAGSASANFDSSHYIVTTDTDGKKSYFIRTNAKDRGGIEKEKKWIEEPSEDAIPMFNLISNDSAFSYIINIKKRSGEVIEGVHGYRLEINSYHLAAPEAPQKVATTYVDIASTPVQVTLGDDNTLLVVGKRDITLVDVTDPLKPAGISSLILPENEGKQKTAYVDAIFLDDGKQIAVLETYNNTVSLIDASDRHNLNITDTFNILPEKSIALSVDLEPDPNDNKRFWALLGPNYRLAGSRLVDTYKKIFKKNVEESRRAVNRVQSFTLASGKLILGNSVATPEHYATYFAVFGEDGRIYVSATKMDFLNFNFKKGGRLNVIKMVKNFLSTSVSFGRIVAIDPNTGDTETISSGGGIFYHLVDVPDIGPVFSLLKFGPSFSFPYLTPSWGLGVKSTGTYAMRKMNRYAVFPPYSIGYVDFQY
ncbi:MAG: hypothetical protein COA42_14210 [Alteromonadaceae bacterium]|nr:MAG: hypothetical protein COA42_14210 [Alteromonadaceae bacterium]